MSDAEQKPVPVSPEHLAGPCLPQHPADYGFAQIGGYSASHQVDTSQPLPELDPGDEVLGCTTCGSYKREKCDGQGILNVGKAGFVQCPQAAYREIMAQQRKREAAKATG